MLFSDIIYQFDFLFFNSTVRRTYIKVIMNWSYKRYYFDFSYKE